MTSLKEKVGYAMESATEFVKDAVDGKELKVSDEIAEKRMNICLSCEHLKKLAKMEYCEICSCAMRVKTKGASFRCPLDLWGKEN